MALVKGGRPHAILLSDGVNPEKKVLQVDQMNGRAGSSQPLPLSNGVV